LPKKIYLSIFVTTMATVTYHPEPATWVVLATYLTLYS